MENYIKIAQRFRDVRSIDLSKIIGVTYQQLYNWNSGLKKTSREAAQKIASALDVDMAWVLGYPQSIAVIDPVEHDVLSCPVMRTEEIEGYGVMHHVYVDAIGDIIPVLTSADLQFTPCDWQSGYLPKCAAEIGEIKWMDQRGQDAILYDGLPRAFMG